LCALAHAMRKGRRETNKRGERERETEKEGQEIYCCVNKRNTLKPQ